MIIDGYDVHPIALQNFRACENGHADYYGPRKPTFGFRNQCGHIVAYGWNYCTRCGAAVAIRREQDKGGSR